jgi:hypothetical protein
MDIERYMKQFGTGAINGLGLGLLLEGLRQFSNLQERYETLIRPPEGMMCTHVTDMLRPLAIPVDHDSWIRFVESRHLQHLPEAGRGSHLVLAFDRSHWFYDHTLAHNIPGHLRPLRGMCGDSFSTQGARRGVSL